MKDDDDTSHDGAGPSTAPVVEALSTGRAKRSTAGNRMRELLEQERERLEAEESGQGKRPGQVSRLGTAASRGGGGGGGGGGEDDDENALFIDEGDNDVDFQELAGAEGADDIIDSDFDQSSNDGNENEAEDEGERQLIEQEKAAKRASRTKAKALPAHMRPRPALAGQASTSTSSSAEGRAKKRIAFVTTSPMGEEGMAAKRASKRAATMHVTQTVQERVQQDEERRAKLREAAQPKRKKVRLSQADHIAEALEIEESNRESLKIYLEREEERRERERKRSKRRMEGPFLRWRSFAVDCNAVRQHLVLVKQEEAESNHKDTQRTLKEADLLEDPVFAARKAAIEERERLASARRAPSVSKPEPGRITDENNDESTAAQPGEEHGSDHSGDPGQGKADVHTEKTDVPEPSGSNLHLDDAKIVEEAFAPQRVDNTMETMPETTASAVAPTIEVTDVTHTLQDKTSSAIAEDAEPPAPDHEVTASRPPLVTTFAPQSQTQSQAESVAEWEGRALVSLHNIPTATPWPVVFSQVLGPHVDWSRYPVVAARNRPLRPRQSVCPVTGLPARYRDPRTGIAYATREAYDIITSLIHGHYRWSSNAESPSREVDAVKNRITNPLDLGCYMDRIDEPGACNVLLTASAMMPQTQTGLPASSSSTVGKQPTRRGPSMVYASGVLLAPGDEQAVMAAASELPAGSTRSGTRRGARIV